MSERLSRRVDSRCWQIPVPPLHRRGRRRPSPPAPAGRFAPLATPQLSYDAPAVAARATVTQTFAGHNTAGQVVVHGNYTDAENLNGLRLAPLNRTRILDTRSALGVS